ncbi:hypothetical protein WA1_06840 [Scytonema hofmannii PCC 7110]|uniref:Uncharacterized protein n=1 Tax=Scytonema hofmannii PCC 7110 TaxID=128403 RepID=A0A139WSW2_9CYAN|nr:hypothetical protein WA1_06840 [Scytonema hofmannii PCC 7110]
MLPVAVSGAGVVSGDVVVGVWVGGWQETSPTASAVTALTKVQRVESKLKNFNGIVIFLQKNYE